MDNKVTAEQIRDALENTYKSPEWYLGFEVGNSTGGNCRRHADAVAVNAYPSKGFETRGFEIKVSKSDLNSELKNGIKSDEIARFCDYWFLVVPKGLADGFTLPPTWGVVEYANGALRQKKRAEKLDKISPTGGFMCAMLRGRERLLTETAARIQRAAKEAIRADAIGQWRYEKEKYDALQAKLENIRQQTGLSINEWTNEDAIVKKLKITNSLSFVERNMHNISRGANEISELAASFVRELAQIMERNND